MTRAVALLSTLLFPAALFAQVSGLGNVHMRGNIHAQVVTGGPPPSTSAIPIGDPPNTSQCGLRYQSTTGQTAVTYFFGLYDDASANHCTDSVPSVLSTAYLNAIAAITPRNTSGTPGSGTGFKTLADCEGMSIVVASCGTLLPAINSAGITPSSLNFLNHAVSNNDLDVWIVGGVGVQPNACLMTAMTPTGVSQCSTYGPATNEYDRICSALVSSGNNCNQVQVLYVNQANGTQHNYANGCWGWTGTAASGWYYTCPPLNGLNAVNDPTMAACPTGSTSCPYNGPNPSVSSISISGGLASVTCSSTCGFSGGEQIVLIGTSLSALNGVVETVVSDSGTGFTFTTGTTGSSTGGNAQLAGQDATNWLWELGAMMRSAKSRMPNLELALFSAREPAVYCTTGCANPEPEDYEIGHAIKYLIWAQECQMGGSCPPGSTSGQIDPDAGDLCPDITALPGGCTHGVSGSAPMLKWLDCQATGTGHCEDNAEHSSYFWANGATARFDGLAWCNGQSGSPCSGATDFAGPDFLHLTTAGANKDVSGMPSPGTNGMLGVLRKDPYTAPWFCATNTSSGC